MSKSTSEQILYDAIRLCISKSLEASAQFQALLDDRDKWRNIAGNLYDEMRVRGAECLYRHNDATKDCVKDFELADEQ